MSAAMSAPSTRPGTGNAAAKRKRTLVRDTAATALLSQVPPNMPPSLCEKQYSDNELFHYYAVRGNGEVLRNESAVQAALARHEGNEENGSGERNAFAGFASATAWDEDVSEVTRARTATTTTAAAGGSSSGVSGRGNNNNNVCAAASDSGQPVFPRLRPSAAEDARKTTYVHHAKETAQREALQTRKQNLGLPTVEAYYGTLYTPDAALTNHIRDSLQATAMTKVAESQSALTSLGVDENGVALRGGAGAAGGKATRGAPDRPARSMNTGLNSSMRSASLQGGLASGGQLQLPPQSGRSVTAAGMSMTGAGASSGRRSPQADLTAGRSSPGFQDNSARGGSTATMVAAQKQDSADVQAAVLRESHAEAVKEVEDLFVGTYYIQHPDALARKAAVEEEAQRRRSARAASLAMAATDGRRSTTLRSNSTQKKGSKKAKKAKKAPPPRRDGAPAENLRLFTASLAACADEQSRVSLAQFEAILQEVPFEVTNVEAMREFFSLIRQFSQAKQREIAFLAAGVSSSSPHGYYAENSIASTGSGTGHHGSVSKAGSGGVAQSMRSLVNTRSGVTPAQSSARLSVGSRGQQSIQHTASGMQGHGSVAAPGGGGGGSGGLVSPLAAAQTRASPVVYLRELMSALDELLNGDDTRDVVRWVSFAVFAASGQGYIHKASLASLRRQHREECESPQAEITASMVKALGDCFDVIALEEEGSYLNGGKKKNKKRSKKTPVLASNQKSLIPLNVMRTAHMNYATFCRFFDELPQVAAAFSHVWLSLLFTGTIAPTCAAANSADAVSTGAGGGGEMPLTVKASSPRLSHQSPMLSPRGADLTEDTHSSTFAGSAERDTSHARRPSASRFSLTTQSRQGWPQEVLHGLEEPAPVEPGTYPLHLLGEDSIARRATLQRVVVNRLECMKTALEDLQNAQQVDLSQGRASVQKEAA